MSDVKGIVFMKTYYDSISKIKSQSVREELYNAIFNYAFYGNEPDTDNEYVLALFETYRVGIDESMSKYKKKVERMQKINEDKKTKS